MEYLTEIRGGWDEWSDSYTAVVGVKFDTGEEIPSRFLDEHFVDSEGNALSVEFPARNTMESTITIERNAGNYELWRVSSLSDFEAALSETEEDNVWELNVDEL